MLLKYTLMMQNGQSLFFTNRIYMLDIASILSYLIVRFFHSSYLFFAQLMPLSLCRGFLCPSVSLCLSAFLPLSLKLR